jgi:hypothetical protein
MDGLLPMDTTISIGLSRNHGSMVAKYSPIPTTRMVIESLLMMAQLNMTINTIKPTYSPKPSGLMGLIQSNLTMNMTMLAI